MCYERKKDASTRSRLRIPSHNPLAPSTTSRSLHSLTTRGTGWIGPSAGPGLAYSSDPSLNYTNATQSIVPAQCIYSYDSGSARALIEWLADYFNGTVHSAPGASFVTVGGSTPTTAGPSALLMNLYDFGNVTLNSIESTFANITDSITTYLRQNSAGALHGPAIGIVTHNQTCVRIQWAWLTFPAALAIMVLVFFAAMVHGTSQTGTKVRSHDFKSNALPLVYHGLKYNDRKDVPDSGWKTMSQIDRDAKDKFVTLSSTEKGWRFVEMDRGRKA